MRAYNWILSFLFTLLIVAITTLESYAQVVPGSSPQTAAGGNDEGTTPDDVVFVYDQAEVFLEAEIASVSLFCERLLEEYASPTFVVTLPSVGNRFDPTGSALRLADKLYVNLREQSVAAEDAGWSQGMMILISRDDRIAAIHCAEGWDDRDREKIEVLVQSTINPLLNRGSGFAALQAGMPELESLAKTRRIRVDSYWSYFVAMEVDGWKGWWESVKAMFTAPSHRDPLVQLICVFAVVLLWEWIRPWRTAQSHLRDGVGLDIFYTVFNYVLFWSLIGTALCAVSARIFDDFLYEVFGFDHVVRLELNAWPAWLQFPLLLLAMEFCSYWTHRLLHQTDWGWEFHKIHHSARRLDVFNAGRLHFGELLTYQFCSYIPMSLIGFDFEKTFYTGLFVTVFSNLTHANVRLPIGPLKYILNTPQLHIWHHEADAHQRGNVNFGDSLIVWDFVFGTAYVHDDNVDTSKLRLGFEGVEDYPQSFIAQTILPFRNIAVSVLARMRRLNG